MKHRFTTAAVVCVTLWGVTPQAIGSASVALAAAIVVCLLLVVCYRVVTARSREAGETDAASGFVATTWPYQRSYLLLAVFVTAIAVYGSLVPLNYRPVEWHAALAQFKAIPHLPLGVSSRADWVANILLFIPIGYLWLGAVLVDRNRLGRALLAVPLVVVLATALSTTLEFVQIWFPPRTVSQNDILAETIGGVVGAALWLVSGQAVTDWIRSYTGQPRAKSQIDWLLEAYCVGLAIYSVMPLDLTIRATEIAAKYRAEKIELVPFSRMSWDIMMLYELFRNVAVFVPLGMLVSTWLTPKERPVRSLSASLAIGGLAVLAIELAQLLVYSRDTATSDVILGTIGVGIGAWAMRRWRGGDVESRQGPGLRRRTWLWLGLSALYAAVLVVVFCAPFEPIQDHQQINARYHGFWYVPFGRLYYGSEFNATDQVLKKTLFFAPLGAMFALAVGPLSLPRPIRRILLVLLLMVAAGIATGIEMLQVLLPPHVPDITDVILYTTGAAAGMFAAVRILEARGSGPPF